MNFTDILGTAFSSLTRRKVRTFLTALGVTVGIFTIVVMLSLGIGVQTEIDDLFRSIGLENIFVQPKNEDRDEQNFAGRPVRIDPIDAENIAAWSSLPGVKQVVPIVFIDRTINKRIRIPGADGPEVRVDIDPGFGINNPFEQPPIAIAGQLRPEQDGTITISQEVVDELRLNGDAETLLNKEIQLVLYSPRGEEKEYTYTIVGITSLADQQIALTSKDSVEIKKWWYNAPDYLETDGYDAALVQAEDVAAANNLIPQLQSDAFNVQSIETVLDLASKIFLVINIMLGSVGALALFVASIGIMNTMIMSIYERTREIGTLKAIGASRSNVRWLFMAEAGMIGFLGGAIGLFLGWLTGLGLNQVALEYLKREQVPLDGPFFLIPPWLILLSIGFAVLIGILAGVYPAARAARLDPIKALRHE